jgi:pyruvate dehydrogenase E2 component (dihydrolipoamide acetyltransferase)
MVAAFQSGAALTRSAWAQASEGAGRIPDSGTGIGGRVRARDLISGSSPGATLPVGAHEEIKMSGIRKIIAQKMMQSLYETAQLTMQMSANATSLLAYRKAKKGAGFALADIILTAFALIRVLQKFPELNCLLIGDTMYRYKSVHLALAVDTPRGLMVPVIRDAEKLSLKELTTAIMTVSAKCNNGTISPDLLSGGTITLTPLGAFGIESFTPVLNPPQVAILGLNAIVPKPVLDESGEYKMAPHIGLSLTVDHQAVDGAPAARFLKALAEAIENITQTLAAY